MAVNKSITIKKTLNLIASADNLLKNEPNYIELPNESPFLFVGDTHGDFETTQKILKKFSKDHLLVFLGDYVDRAEKEHGSLKNIGSLLEAKVKTPDKIILLRGNHEFESQFFYNGFGEELHKYTTSEVYKQFKGMFSNLPYIAVTKNGVIALHGGIPNFSTISQLKNLPKGIHEYEEHNLISQIVWNDHINDNGGLLYDGIKHSARGSNMDLMFEYGEDYFSKKMKQLNKKVLLRGHDPQSKGYGFNNQILTIFSSQRYSRYGNLKGVFVAKLDPNKKISDATGLEIITLE